MVVKVFGRPSCVRTRTLIRRLRCWLEKTLGEGGDWVEFIDLETPAGLAEAAFLQVEGSGPSVLVEAGPYRETVCRALMQARVRTQPVQSGERPLSAYPSLN